MSKLLQKTSKLGFKLFKKQACKMQPSSRTVNVPQFMSFLVKELIKLVIYFGKSLMILYQKHVKIKEEISKLGLTE